MKYKRYNMEAQIERAHLLKSLHIKGDPLILFNIWDARSAQAIQETGGKSNWNLINRKDQIWIIG